MKSRLLGIALAGAMVFAACGDDDDGGGSAESNEYSDALAAMFKAEGEVPFSDDEIDCLARELVDAVGGPSALEDAGIEPGDIEEGQELSDTDLDLGDDEAEAIANSFGDCDISIAEAFLAEMGDEVPEETRDCIEDSLDDEALADFFAQTLIEGEDSGDDLPPALMEDLMGCISG